MMYSLINRKVKVFASELSPALIDGVVVRQENLNLAEFVVGKRVFLLYHTRS
jgi:hypothetical protein